MAVIPSKHQAVFSALHEEILSGKYTSSGRVPSEAQICRRFRISRATAIRALRDLASAGIITRRVGSGSFINILPRKHFGSIFLGSVGDSIFAPIYTSIAKYCQQHQTDLILGNVEAKTSAETAQLALDLCRRFIKDGVNGVFITPLDTIPNANKVNQELVSRLEEAKIPTILLDRDVVALPARSKLDLVGIDNMNAGFRLASHLLEQGARKIFFITRYDTPTTVQQRISGLMDAIIGSGFHFEKGNTLYGDPTDIDFVRKLIRGKPDAIVCSNDIVAAFLMTTLRTLKIRIPEDVLVAGFDDLTLAAHVTPPLTTIHQPCDEIGRMAVSALFERIENPDLAPRTILLDAPIVIRESTVHHHS